MKNCLIICTLLLSLQTSWGQLSSLDIRQVSGKGPYPIYINFQFPTTSTRPTFRNFINAYKQEYGTKSRNRLWGFESNLGIVINDDNLLGITGLSVHGVSLEFGYSYMDRLFINGGTHRMRVQEEALSIRLGWRNNLIYPITFQIQGGPVLLSYASVRESLNGSLRRAKIGNSLFTNRSSRVRPRLPGFEGRFRLMLMDPAGTSGGLGFYFEGRYLYTIGKRQLSPFYRLAELGSRNDVQNWNYLVFSVGFVAPLALPIPSS